MIASKKDLILRELEEGTGAAISIAENLSGLRSGLRIWFSDLEEKRGPVAELKPHGLRGYRVHVAFGTFSAPVISQIRNADFEHVQLARALVNSVTSDVEFAPPEQSKSDWSVQDGRFVMSAVLRQDTQSDSDLILVNICREVIVPMMAAMAELIGYDEIEEDEADNQSFEGAVKLSIVKRRERNPRNRLLCIRVHGEKCAVCDLRPKDVYGHAGSIIEVHHIVPVASLVAPRAYDPNTDLVPLCPNCHRSVHTRRPVPFSVQELRQKVWRSRD